MAGMTRRETEMVARFEAGQPVQRIAAEMGLSVQTVRQVTSYFTTGLVDNGSHRRAMTMGSKLLAKAIREQRSR